jgi:hypothetical protein
MKSILGLALAAGVALAFALAWRFATRDGASFLDQQWLFLAAAPYNLSLVAIFGESDFSPDALGQVAAATAAEAGVAYIVGAAIEAAVRGAWRALRRLRAPA